MGDLEDRSVNTAPAGDPSVDVGTAEDVEAVMKKYDRESNTRIWTGVPELVIRIMLALFSLFMVWMNLFASFWALSFCLYSFCTLRKREHRR